ncbi:unnamed protein product [Cylicocyclus nassatus]|uniref:Uncharacterized protein n=1 Tax=Cylicocyclus nassatus TaxID=53992 RepID=A0AA36HGZ2_CYLNA|nr:unnamed protein product [Cylicocyclus nassatus]
MAFITPVVTKEFNLYSQEKSKSKSRRHSAPEIGDTKDDTLDASGAKKSRLELMREKRLRHYNKRIQRTHPLRKISEISNEAVNEDELTFDRVQNGFTIMKRLVEVPEPEEKHDQSKDKPDSIKEQKNQKAKTHSAPEISKSSKQGMVLKMFHWMARRHPIRAK